MESFISKSLIELRKSKHLTQTQFGKLLGMSRSKVSSWEIGRRDISVSDAVIICDYFDISLDCFLNPNNISCKKVIDVLENYINNKEVSYQEKHEIFKKIEDALEKDSICLS